MRLVLISISFQRDQRKFCLFPVLLRCSHFEMLPPTAISGYGRKRGRIPLMLLMSGPGHAYRWKGSNIWDAPETSLWNSLWKEVPYKTCLPVTGLEWHMAEAQRQFSFQTLAKHLLRATDNKFQTSSSWQPLQWWLLSKAAFNPSFLVLFHCSSNDTVFKPVLPWFSSPSLSPFLLSIIVKTQKWAQYVDVVWPEQRALMPFIRAGHFHCSQDADTC